jgi:hypothetical protein
MLFKKAKSRRSEKNRFRRVFLEQLEDRRLLTTFAVDTILDTVDVNPGNGVALDAAGNTSLRAAIMEANALAGDDQIILPAGTFQFTRTGVGENFASTGDLDINSNVTIVGAGAELTIINANRLDRVLQIDGVVSLTDLTIAGGQAPGPNQPGNGYGGGIHIDGGVISLERVRVTDNYGNFGVGGISNLGDLTI